MHKATHQKLSSFITTSTITTTTINRIILSNLLRHCKKHKEISPLFFTNKQVKQAKQLIKTNKKAENHQAYIRNKDPEKRWDNDDEEEVKSEQKRSNTH